MIQCNFEDGGEADLRHVTVGVIVLNREKDKILLIKRSSNSFVGANKIGIPGGYMGRGETTLQTAAREVLEETGYEITVEKLFRINDNPNRPKEDRQNVEFVYLGQEIKKVGKHDTEVAEVLWIPLTDIPKEEEFAFDHRQSIELFLKYLKTPFSLPIMGSV